MMLELLRNFLFDNEELKVWINCVAAQINCLNQNTLCEFTNINFFIYAESMAVFLLQATFNGLTSKAVKLATMFTNMDEAV